MNVMVYFSPETLSNSYIIYSDNHNGALLLDPQSFDVSLYSLLESRDLFIEGVLLTHCKPESSHAVRTIRKIYAPAIFSGSDVMDSLYMTNVKKTENFNCAGMDIRPFHVSGNYGDSILYLIDNSLFSGDLVSAGSIIRADGSYGRKLLIHSLRELFSRFPGSTIIYPLYGPPSTLAIESITNPDLRGSLQD